jgi:hypothetical protein
MNLAKVFRNLLPKTKENNNGGNSYYKFGHNDNLPLELIEAINNSGVAKKSLKKYSDYVQADGFVSPIASTKIVNNETKETADLILRKIALAFAYFNGAFLHIKRNGLGLVEAITLFPNQKIRRGLDGKSWLYNPTIGTDKVEKNTWVKYQNFVGYQATLEDLQDNINEYDGNGEIYYCNDGNIFDSSIYSLPDYLSSIEDIKTSAEISKMDYEAVLNGFVLGGVMTFVGVDNTSEDETGQTEEDRISDGLTSFTGLKKNSDGLSSRFGLLVNFVKTAEQVPTYTGFDPKPILEASNAKRDIIERAVCKLWSVHPVLLGYSEASVLGNDKAIQQAMDILKQSVNPIQRIITQMFVDFYGSSIDWTISEFGVKKLMINTTTDNAQ